MQTVQAIFETIFDIAYLCTVIALGVILIRQTKKESPLRLFGWMAIILGGGDAFHLIPRGFSLWTGGLEAHASALGVGKFVTSITMTVFYVLLYMVLQKRYQLSKKSKTAAAVYILAALRIVLCLFPQNQWLVYQQPLLWGVLRNLPFAALGILLIVLLFQKGRKNRADSFRWMWLAVTLSFGFYIPVVLLANAVPPVGMLMIPKTVAYVWIVWMGFRAFQKESERK